MHYPSPSDIPGVDTKFIERNSAVFRSLHAHEARWGHEPMPTRRDLPKVAAGERVLFDDLRDDLIRPQLGFEQERTAFHLVVEAVDRASRIATRRLVVEFDSRFSFPRTVFRNRVADC